LEAAKATRGGNLAADVRRDWPKNGGTACGGKVTTTLTADERRALVLLSSSGQNGATQQLLSAHGFGVPMVAGLVHDGFATMTREQMNAGGKLVEVGKVRITDAGREALTAEG
jgi:hypothetical protein